MSILKYCYFLLACAFVGARPSTASPYKQLQDSQLGENVYLHKGFPWNQAPENLNVFIPTSATNGFDASGRSLPIVIFYSGFGSNLPTGVYGSVLTEMASKANGAVVVAWDGLGVANPLDIAGIVDRASLMLEFHRNGGLQNLIDKYFKVPVTVDVNQIFFAGHSSGNQIATLMAKTFDSLGLILLDPVDSDPVKWTKPVITAPLVNFTKPVLVVASGLGEERGIQAGNVVPPCCPPGFSSDHFYQAFPSTKRFYLKASDYGHADLLSPDPIAILGHLSRFCATAADINQTPFQAYRDFVSGSVAAFVAGLSGSKPDCGMFDYLVDPTLFNLKATGTHSLGNFDKLCY